MEGTEILVFFIYPYYSGMWLIHFQFVESFLCGFTCDVMALVSLMEGKFSLGLSVCSGHYNKRVWASPEKVGVLKYLIKHPTTLVEIRNWLIIMRIELSL